MKRILLLCLIFFQISVATARAESVSEAAAKAYKLYQDGNYHESFLMYREIILSPHHSGRDLVNPIALSVSALSQSGRVKEFDSYIQEVIEQHPTDWPVLHAAATAYSSVPHSGYLISGNFERGQHRGGGSYASSLERDRTRALQLYFQALPHALKDTESSWAVADFLTGFAEQVIDGGRGSGASWRLQELTEIDSLPDYEKDFYGYHQASYAAPVDPDGNPLLYFIPNSLESAKNDGERWRWLLKKAAEIHPQRAAQLDIQFAGFLLNQFGVQTMQNSPGRWGAPGGEVSAKHTLSLETLSDTEFLARLANGIKRFTLPREYSYFEILKRVAAQEGSFQRHAIEQLASIYENRQQYPRAAHYWQESITRFGANNHNTARLEQIVGNWGQFEQSEPLVAGEQAKFGFRFRNARSVSFTAQRVNLEELLGDLQEKIASNPSNLDYWETGVQNLGQRLIQQDQRRYLGETVKEWTVPLTPREAHKDSLTDISIPFNQAGVYFLTAQIAEGRQSHVILWRPNTVILKKPLQNQILYYVADAVSGKGLANTQVDFFGYRREYKGRTILQQNRYETLIKKETKVTDANGIVIGNPAEFDSGYQWLATLSSKDGHKEFLGFHGIWFGSANLYMPNHVRAFGITDRPVYRPGDEIKFSFWIRQPNYDSSKEAHYANRSFTVQVYNPRGEKVWEKAIQADAYAGLFGSFTPEDSAPLGRYNIRVSGYSGEVVARLEEYKKPEFEVLIQAPDKPIQLGDRFQATVEAKYYFGQPVTKGTVHYKVHRYSHDSRFYPIRPWDWLYGNGYWWTGYNYSWYPGWKNWGCEAPYPFWNPRPHTPPELVAESEVELDEHGKAFISIDTKIARELFGDSDQRYEISAEVVDESRRTISGSRSVIAARNPFEMLVWLDRAYYKTGDKIEASFAARTPDGTPVPGKGIASLFRVTVGADDSVSEKLVGEWSVHTDDEGSASLSITGQQSGQYRLSYTLTDSGGRSVEKAFVFSVLGSAQSGSDFRFNDLELLPDRQTYVPGDSAELRINTRQNKSTVLLFVRPENGYYNTPEVLRLDGKSVTHKISIAQEDMPNFFVEAVTIANGKLFTETRQLIVPPVEKALRVELEPSGKVFKPGEAGRVNVSVRDALGQPFAGSVVLTIYDKAVEYISGGSNVGDILAYYWGWKRSHQPSQQSSLERYGFNMVERGVTAMQYLGVFGRSVARDQDYESVQPVQKRALKSEGLAFSDDALPASAPAEAEMVLGESALRKDGGGRQEEPAAEVHADLAVRKNFADSILWTGTVVTDEQGRGNFEFTIPDNVTTWKIRSWALGNGTRVGSAENEIISTKDVVLRLQSPRFFVEKDRVWLSANVHNYTTEQQSFEVSLELDGEELSKPSNQIQSVEIPAGGEQRVDWEVEALNEGEVRLRMRARGRTGSDAVEMTFPVLVHGMLKMDAWSRAILDEQHGTDITFTVPKERRPEQTKLTVRVSPSIALAMIDALPYLASYPYGCTEQTLNRFLPTVITQSVLRSLGYSLAEIQEKITNINPQELGDSKERAAQWRQWKENPVFNEATVQEMSRAGVQRLLGMQNSDGGWGWFSGTGEQSYPHTTAVVVHGLQLARENDIQLPAGMLESGVQWLRRYQDTQRTLLENADTKTEPYKTTAGDIDALVHMILVEQGVHDDHMRAFLFRDRTALSVYAKALFGLALHAEGQQDLLTQVLRNIKQFLRTDKENQTAYLDLSNSTWWYWSGDEIEANAYYLKLLSRVDPQGDTAAGLAKYLLNNRKHASYWKSTRDTAVAIEALAEYVRESGEAAPDLSVQVSIDGVVQRSLQINKENLFTFDGTLVLSGSELSDGEHSIHIEKEGRGRLFANAYLENFTLEDSISRAGLEVKVNRKYFRLERDDERMTMAGNRGQVLTGQREDYQRVELKNLDQLRSGDLVEIELTIDSKNDYEYLMFEDMKAAGFEPIEVQSGYNGNEMNAYVEYRDEKVVFFVRTLARGTHSVSYRMRAEIPGQFSALPTRAEAMYAPELRANSDEIKLRISE